LGLGSYSVKYQDKKAKNTIIEGDMASAKDVFDLPMATGRWFSDFDDEHHSAGGVICYQTQHELFGDQDPLGKEINIEGRLFDRDRHRAEDQIGVRRAAKIPTTIASFCR
jgi:hypothetical protein